MGKLLSIAKDEKKLIKQLKRGNEKAQRQLFELHAPLMLAVCRRYTQSIEDAEEVLSNGFIKVFERIDQYRGEGALGGWIRQIMVREALNFVRYQKNLFVEADESRDLSLAHSAFKEQHEAEYLMRFIDQLPTGYQTVFNLYAIEGYGHKEIAEMLEISESTSKSQLRKARLQLQEKLEEENKILYKEN